jgi:hypothetical protein
MAAVTNGATVAVPVAGRREGVGEVPPNGVGVAYCPHREGVPPQDASRKEAAIKKLIRRFTK